MAAGAAASSAGGLGDDTVQGDWLNFDQSESGRCRLQGEFRTFGAPFVQDEQHDFLAVQCPFQIDELQVEAPTSDARDPTVEFVAALRPELIGLL